MDNNTFKYGEYSLDTPGLILNLQNNISGFSQYRRYDDAQDLEFKAAVKLYADGIKNGTIVADGFGHFDDSNGVLTNDNPIHRAAANYVDRIAKRYGEFLNEQTAAQAAERTAFSYGSTGLERALFNSINPNGTTAADFDLDAWANSVGDTKGADGKRNTIGRAKYLQGVIDKHIASLDNYNFDKSGMTKDEYITKLQDLRASLENGIQDEDYAKMQALGFRPDQYKLIFGDNLGVAAGAAAQGPAQQLQSQDSGTAPVSQEPLEINPTETVGLELTSEDNKKPYDSEEWSATDLMYVGSAAADLAALIDPEPFTAIGLGLASDAATAIADFKNDNLGLHNLGNVGLTLLGGIPVIGDALGSGSKVVKNIVKIAPRLNKWITGTLVSMQVLDGKMALEYSKSINNIVNGNFDANDTRNALQAIQLVLGLGNAYKNNKANKKVEEVIGTNGKKGKPGKAGSAEIKDSIDIQLADGRSIRVNGADHVKKINELKDKPEELKKYLKELFKEKITDDMEFSTSTSRQDAGISNLWNKEKAGTRDPRGRKVTSVETNRSIDYEKVRTTSEELIGKRRGWGRRSGRAGRELENIAKVNQDKVIEINPTKKSTETSEGPKQESNSKKTYEESKFENVSEKVQLNVAKTTPATQMARLMESNMESVPGAMLKGKTFKVESPKTISQVVSPEKAAKMADHFNEINPANTNLRKYSILDKRDLKVKGHSTRAEVEKDFNKRVNEIYKKAKNEKHSPEGKELYEFLKQQNPKSTKEEIEKSMISMGYWKEGGILKAAKGDKFDDYMQAITYDDEDLADNKRLRHIWKTDKFDLANRKDVVATDNTAPGNNRYDPESGTFDLVTNNLEKGQTYSDWIKVLLSNERVAKAWADRYRSLNAPKTSHYQGWYDKAGNFSYKGFKEWLDPNLKKHVWEDGVNGIGHDLYRGRVFQIENDPENKWYDSLLDDYEIVPEENRGLTRNGLAYIYKMRKKGTTPGNDSQVLGTPDSGLSTTPGQTVLGAQSGADADKDPNQEYVGIPKKKKSFDPDPILDALNYYNALEHNNDLLKLAEENKPLLYDPIRHTKYEEGDYESLTAGSRNEAAINNQALKADVSDGSLLAAKALEGKIQGAAEYFKGITADNAARKESRKAAYDTNVQGDENEYNIAMKNRENIHAYDRELTSTKMAKRRADWESLTGFINNLRSRFAAQRQKDEAYRDFYNKSQLIEDMRYNPAKYIKGWTEEHLRIWSKYLNGTEKLTETEIPIVTRIQGELLSALNQYYASEYGIRNLYGEVPNMFPKLFDPKITATKEDDKKEDKKEEGKKEDEKKLLTTTSAKNGTKLDTKKSESVARILLDHTKERNKLYTKDIDRLAKGVLNSIKLQRK